MKLEALPVALDCHSRKPSPPNTPIAAFTLIELLVVIAIIVILAGLGFSAVSGALKTAKKAEVRAMANQIKAAIAAYHAEYGTYPTNAKADANFLKIMTAQDTKNNRRGIRFLEIPPKFLDKDSIVTPERLYEDPKKRETFSIVTDAMSGSGGKPYDGKIKLPDGKEISGSVAVWVPDPEKPTIFLGTW
jgi:prepilin-type N-terminal cleavage/methylation domain-containing protein